MKRGTDSPTGQPDDASDINARVVVAVRIRPLRAESAMERYDTSCLYCTAPEGTAQVEAPTTVTIINPTTKEQTDFAFDRVFDEADGQASVYSELVEDTLLHTIERGGDVTMVAYGQTGSGKTFTMLGERGGAPSPTSTASSPLLRSSLSSGGLRSPVSAAHTDWLSPDSGVFLRAVNTLMNYRDLQKATSHVTIYLQAVEIYNDTFIDLLAKGAHKNERQGWQRPNQAPPAGSGVIEPREVGENLVLSNALRIPLDTLDDVQRCFDISHRNRSVSATNMNDVSSRSHAIFLIEMVTQAKFALDGGLSQPPDIDAVMEHELQQWVPTVASTGASSGSFAARSMDAMRPQGPQVRSALLTAMVAKNPSNDFDLHPLHICRVTLVDLAGSERVKRSGVVGKGMQEAVFVNSSLSTLGLVVHSLCAKQQQSTKHIPFRDSKMTRVLRPSFVSPSAKVIFVTNISPTSQSYVETLNSMRFASRLKDLKYSTPPQTSGPSLGLLLNDERLQRLRQQFDEMSADIRIYHMTSGTTTNGFFTTSLRRALVEQAKTAGHQGTARSVAEDLLVRPPNVKEALQRCRAEAAVTQEASERVFGETRQAILDQMMAAARQSGRINEDETEMTVDHLRDSIARMEAELQLSRMTCTADVQQWRDRVDSAEVQGDAISSAYGVLVKRKRDLYHENITKRTEFDDLDEEATVILRSKEAAASRLEVEKALKNTEMEDSGSDRRTVNTTIEYLDTLLKRLTAATDLHVTLRHLGRLDQQQRDATAPSLVAHELSPTFSHRLAALPLKDLFDSHVVRTSEGRHRLLNERLEQASVVFTVSPMAFYFNPEEATRPTKYVPWEDRRRGSSSTRHASDNDSDDDLVYDEDLEATAERCASRGPSMQTNDVGSPPGAGKIARLGASLTAPLGEQLVEYYLRIVALYGHLMRVTARAEKRKRKLPNAPLLSNGEARAIFVILDAVEVDERVVEDIVRNAHRQLDPVEGSSALSPHTLKSPASEHGLDAWDTNSLPAVASDSSRSLMARVARLIKSSDVLSVPHLRFVPCLVRCLQALTLISLYEALLSMRLPGGEGAGFQKTLLKKMSKRLVALQSATDTQTQEDAAILKGCQYACRASVGSSGGAWTMDDLTAAEERSRLKERIRVGVLSSQPSNASPQQPQAGIEQCDDRAKRHTSTVAPLFLWAHPRSCDLSPLRGLATKCLLHSQLLQPADAALDDQVPTQPRFLECLLLVLRQGH
jgi:hypothetical protein